MLPKNKMHLLVLFAPMNLIFVVSTPFSITFILELGTPILTNSRKSISEQGSIKSAICPTVYSLNISKSTSFSGLPIRFSYKLKTL